MYSFMIFTNYVYFLFSVTLSQNTISVVGTGFFVSTGSLGIYLSAGQDLCARLPRQSRAQTVKGERRALQDLSWC